MKKWLHGWQKFENEDGGFMLIKIGRKRWSRARHEVEPKHFVGGYFEIDMFRLYKRRKPWKPWKYRSKNYVMRGYQ